MPQEHSKLRERNKSEIKPPGEYAVIFHNDDFTPMDFVVVVLTHIFFKDIEVATFLMLKVHNEGKATVGHYAYDIALSKTSAATELARQNGYPLRISVENS